MDCMTFGTRVLVGGMPGTGNHLCAAHVERLPDAKAFVRHLSWVYQSHLDVTVEYLNLSTHILIPHRNERDRLASADRRNVGPGMNPDSSAVLRHMRKIALALTTTPIYHLDYEDLIATDGGTLDDIIREWGYDAPAWPSEVMYGDRGMIYGAILKTTEERRDAYEEKTSYVAL